MRQMRPGKNFPGLKYAFWVLYCRLRFQVTSKMYEKTQLCPSNADLIDHLFTSGVSRRDVCSENYIFYRSVTLMFIAWDLADRLRDFKHGTVITKPAEQRPKS